MKSLRWTMRMLSTVVYQSTIGCMLAERSTKWANSAGAMGLESSVRGARTVSMGDLLGCLSLRRGALAQQPAGGTRRHLPGRRRGLAVDDDGMDAVEGAGAHRRRIEHDHVGRQA